MSGKLITTASGRSIEVDTSDEACLEFGFQSGDRVIFRGEKGVVEGVSDQGCYGCADRYDCDNPAKDQKALFITFETNSGATFLPKENCSELKKIE
ncbi:MAG: hypothetical protein WC422_00635 [Candidatus Paceibacterota bacterium]|jgi:hypothetical protein